MVTLLVLLSSPHTYTHFATVSHVSTVVVIIVMYLNWRRGMRHRHLSMLSHFMNSPPTTPPLSATHIHPLRTAPPRIPNNSTSVNNIISTTMMRKEAKTKTSEWETVLEWCVVCWLFCRSTMIKRERAINQSIPLITLYLLLPYLLSPLFICIMNNKFVCFSPQKNFRAVLVLPRTTRCSPNPHNPWR